MKRRQKLGQHPGQHLCGPGLRICIFRVYNCIFTCFVYSQRPTNNQGVVERFLLQLCDTPLKVTTNAAVRVKIKHLLPGRQRLLNLRNGWLFKRVIECFVGFAGWLVTRAHSALQARWNAFPTSMANPACQLCSCMNRQSCIVLTTARLCSARIMQAYPEASKTLSSEH